MKKKSYCIGLLLGIMVLAFSACEKDVKPENMPNYLQVTYENTGKTRSAIDGVLTKEGFEYDATQSSYVKTFSDGTKCQVQPEFRNDSLITFMAGIQYPATTSHEVIKEMYKKWNDYAYNTIFRPIGLWGSVITTTDEIEAVLTDPSALDGAYVDGPLLTTFKLMLTMSGNTELVAMINEMLANTHLRTEYIANDAYASYLLNNGVQAELFFTLREMGTGSGFDLSQFANAKQESGYMAGLYDEENNTYNIVFIYEGIQTMDLESIIGGFMTPAK